MGSLAFVSIYVDWEYVKYIYKKCSQDKALFKVMYLLNNLQAA